MGNLNGKEVCRRDQVAKITRAATSVIPALLIPWASFSLLRHCVSAQAGYIARGSEIATNMDEFTEFNAAIDSCILSIAQIPLTLREDPDGVFGSFCSGLFR